MELTDLKQRLAAESKRQLDLVGGFFLAPCNLSGDREEFALWHREKETDEPLAILSLEVGNALAAAMRPSEPCKDAVECARSVTCNLYKVDPRALDEFLEINSKDITEAAAPIQSYAQQSYNAGYRAGLEAAKSAIKERAKDWGTSSEFWNPDMERASNLLVETVSSLPIPGTTSHITKEEVEA